jgi:hypothetical protein
MHVPTKGKLYANFFCLHISNKHCPLANLSEGKFFFQTAFLERRDHPNLKRDEGPFHKICTLL